MGELSQGGSGRSEVLAKGQGSAGGVDQRGPIMSEVLAECQGNAGSLGGADRAGSEDRANKAGSKGRASRAGWSDLGKTGTRVKKGNPSMMTAPVEVCGHREDNSLGQEQTRG